MAQQSIGFIGAGNMATALVGGMIAKGIRPARIWMSDVSQERLSQLAEQHRVHTSVDNRDVASRADVLVLAVKPQMMEEVCASLRETCAEKSPLIISIAAGISVEQLRRWLGDLPVIRSMPNTPALVRTGATGLFPGPGVSEEQKELAQQILGSAGLTFWFDQEAELDKVTAVSGSGPAYFFLLMESMINAATELGLAPDTARQLVLQTALGAAQLAVASDKEPAELRQQVTSPGGTTAAAIETFEAGGYRELVDKAVRAAHARAGELGE